MTRCEIRVPKSALGRGLFRCGRSARNYDILWHGQSLGVLALCRSHKRAVLKYPVDLRRIHGRKQRRAA